MKSLSRVRLLVTPWTAAYQAPPSMGFSRQQYWSGVPLPSPKDLQIYDIKTQERGRLEILDERCQATGDNESKGLNPIGLVESNQE